MEYHFNSLPLPACDECQLDIHTYVHTNKHIDTWMNVKVTCWLKTSNYCRWSSCGLYC